MLQMKPLRPFHNLEVCAVQTEAGGLVYGEVLDESSAAGAPIPE